MADVGDVNLQREVPLARRSTQTASSKSRAVSPSMVTISSVAKIAAALRSRLRGSDLGIDARLLQNVIGELMRDVMRANQDLDVDPEIVGLAENFDDRGRRAARRRRRNRESPP